MRSGFMVSLFAAFTLGLFSAAAAPQEIGGAAAATVTIAQTPTDLTFTSGTVKLAFKLDGSETVNQGLLCKALSRCVLH